MAIVGHLIKEGRFSLAPSRREQSHMVEKVWLVEFAAAGHIVSAVTKRRR